MKIISENLSTIKNIFQKNRVVLAYLFGSAAKGKTTKLSDFDLAVLLNKVVKPNKYFAVRLSLLDKLGRIIKNKPLDVVILNEASPLLAQMVTSRGKIIYCQNNNIKTDFQIKTLKNFDDAIYLKKTYYHYLENRVKNNKLGEVSLGSETF